MSTGRKEFVGPFRMFHLIRVGATYEIWAVQPLGESVSYAMKWLPPGEKHTRQAANELKHEHTVGKSLVHDSIITTHDFGTGKDGTYLTMELFKTPNLKQQITEGVEKLHYRLEEILTGAALALEHMHKQGWTHRDVKPDNYLVGDNNEVRLIDFTIARKIPKGLGKMFGGKAPVQGTYSYMSPEQIRGKEVDARADIYSFGCMVYELMTGKGAIHRDQLNRATEQASQSPTARAVDDAKEHPTSLRQTCASHAGQRSQRPSRVVDGVLSRAESRPLLPHQAASAIDRRGRSGEESRRGRAGVAEETMNHKR